jgi:hypothetical protein
MLLFIAFVCFAILLASWLAMPEQRGTASSMPAERVSPEVGSASARA